jgi:hypothetical protein
VGGRAPDVVSFGMTAPADPSTDRASRKKRRRADEDQEAPTGNWSQRRQLLPHRSSLLPVASHGGLVASFGGLATFPGPRFGVLVGFEVLVDLEEMSDLIELER